MQQQPDGSPGRPPSFPGRRPASPGHPPTSPGRPSPAPAQPPAPPAQPPNPPNPPGWPLIPPGRLGISTATALALARGVLVLRLVACVGATAATLLLTGALFGSSSESSSAATSSSWSGSRPGQLEFIVPLVIVAVASLAELRLLPRLAAGPPRVALIALDALAGTAVLLVGGGTDPTYIIVQAGTAALAGTLLGLMALPVWIGQAAQAGAVGWIVIGGGETVSATATLALLASPVLVLVAGLIAVAAHQVLLTKLEDALDQPNPYPTVAALLRQPSASIRKDRNFPARLARALTNDALADREVAGQPVRNLYFDDPATDFTTSLQRLCTDWSMVSRVSLRTRLDPVHARPTVQHGLATIVAAALDNVTQHAHATRTRLELTERGRHLHLSIHDNGRGFTVPPDDEILRGGRHRGLAAMAERATSMGATLTIISEPYGGTTIKVLVNP